MMKARRDARSRATGSTRTDALPHSSNPHSPNRVPVSLEGNIVFPSVHHADAGEDFVAPSEFTISHPMPRSLDNGATLDWSGKEATDEPKHDRKWSLSINKRKPKDKVVSLSPLDHSSLGITRDSDYDGLFHHHSLQTQLLTAHV